MAKLDISEKSEEQKLTVDSDIIKNFKKSVKKIQNLEARLS